MVKNADYELTHIDYKDKFMDDKKYEELLETRIKVNYPYEYALLKSDLKENMKKRPPCVASRDTKEEFHIPDKNIRRQIRWSGKIIY